ncbi:sodium/calcium exchanger 2b isoform X1 [Tachysurus ichikawai]
MSYQMCSIYQEGYSNGPPSCHCWAPTADDHATCRRFSFESNHSQCMENCGTVSLAVVCHGGTGENTFYVDYRTEDGTANAGSDYEYSEGMQAE